MLNPQKRNLVLATVAVLALIGVIGVVAKKKIGTHGTATSTETSTEPGQTAGTPSVPGTPDSPGTPHLANPAQPGAEPSEGEDTTYAHKGGAGHETGAGHKTVADEAKIDSAPAISLAMLSQSERARIEREYPEFKNQAPRVHKLPGQDQAEADVAQDHAGKNGQAKGVKQAKGTAQDEADVSLPKLTLAMLSPAEQERIQKKYPELFKNEQARRTSDSGLRTQDSGQRTSDSNLAPIPTKPGQPLVLLQPGMPGHPDTPVIQGASHTDLAQAPKPEPAVDSCYTVTYHHKHPGMRTGDETCAHHKNLIRLHPAEGLRLSPKTVCIRVNGTPVKFTPVKGKPADFIIGIVVGMDTAVTARYCTGKFRCNEDCKVPKDEFVESIAGSDMDSDESHKLEVAVWDKEDPADHEANAKLAGDMHKGLKDLDEVAKAAAEGYTLFENWIPDQQSLACQNHQAQGPAIEDDEATEKPHRKVASKR